jgi:hypothetical protein
VTPKKKPFRRPRVRHKRLHVSSTVDQNVKLTLEMLGFDIPSLIEHFLENVAGQKRCPCCGREVRPLIVGRKVD